MNFINADTWTSDWLWSLPLILVCIIIHVFGLVFINNAVVTVLTDKPSKNRFMYRFAFVMAGAVLLVIVLHGIEASDALH